MEAAGTLGSGSPLRTLNSKLSTSRPWNEPVEIEPAVGRRGAGQDPDVRLWAVALQPRLWDLPPVGVPVLSVSRGPTCLQPSNSHQQERR